MIRLAVRVRQEQAELVLAELLELAPAGVEEVQLGEGLIEYAVYGAPGELPSLPDLRAAAGEALVEISTSETADDWQERWRQFHRPVLIAAPRVAPAAAAQVASGAAPQVASGASVQLPALHVRPPWEPATAAADGLVEEIVIDPGQAFGTGAHATTALCLELLLDLLASVVTPGPLLDVGTGSGVLAIAAARLGFAPVLALDHESESVEAARANALVNDVELAVRRFDLRKEALPQVGSGEGEVLLANLLLPLLLELSRTMTVAPAHMIASGLLREQADQVASAFAEHFELRERRRLERGEWAALWLAAD